MVHAGWLTATLAAAFAVAKADVDPIVIKGSKFFYKTNGTQFFIRGVAYQQDASAGGNSSDTSINDPLTSSSNCQRDIPYLSKLRTNTIRVYSIDPTQDHDDCMSQLADAGIYVLADLAAPDDSIVSTDPTWNDDLYARYASVIDTMQKYSNMLGFFAGNEVIFNTTVADSAPFVKAAVRDMKAYVKAKDYRPMGIGYAADDDPSIRGQMEDYLNCGSTDDGIDFFGYNVYSWCGNASYSSSHYEARTQEFSNYSVPVFFAEYGCNTSPPREWTETLALFGDQMSPVWSGGIAFEYFQAANNYGLVTIDGSSVSTLSDFSRLSTQIAKVTPSSVDSDSYNPSNTAVRDCPASADGWAVSTALPPSPNQQLCSCMVKNLTCVANSGISDEAISELFGTACDPKNGDSICDGIAQNGTTGDYGAYSMCSDSEKLSWAFNAYYMEQKAQNSANTDACDFGGNATQQSASLASGCESLVDQAGAAGTGTVTSSPTSAGGSSGSSSSSSAAFALQIPPFDMQILGVSVYVTVAAIAGAGVLFL